MCPLGAYLCNKVKDLDEAWMHVTLSFDFTDSDMLQGYMEEKSSLKL